MEAAMRRAEREITEKSAMETIIQGALVCRLGLSDKNLPYVVPLCFGYEKGTLYFHCARQGMKLDILAENPHACFQLETGVEIVPGAEACDWGMRFRSVIGFGRATLIHDPRAKRKALTLIMEHYGVKGPFSFPDEALEKTTVIGLEIESMSGKEAGY
jgi:nitroimidazol reductase NimA-like FMN-containing flavoprotein (pyridoxamine 5'-phosphate oxidase superfamily)